MKKGISISWEMKSHTGTCLAILRFHVPRRDVCHKILIVAVRAGEHRVGGNETKATDRSVHQGVKAEHLMNDEIRTLFCLSNATFSN